MSTKENHTGIKKWVKMLAWFLAAIVLLVIILRLSLKTAPVQNWVKSFALSTANEQLNAELTIDELSGDLWKEISISGLKLASEDTIAKVDSIYISYSILSFLGDQFEIAELEVYRPQIHLRQQNGQWNVQKLMTQSADTADTTGGGFPFRIDEFMLNEGFVSVQSEELSVETDFIVDELEISSSFSLATKGFSFNLLNLSFQIEQTQLSAPLKFQTSARADSNSITLEKLVLSTGSSMLRSSAFASQKDSTVRLDLSASPIAWKDIAEYASQFPVNENLEIDLGVSGTLPQFAVSLDMRADGLQSLQMMAQLRWQQKLSLQEFELEMERFNPAILLGDTSLPKIQTLSGKFAGSIDFKNIENSYGDATLSAIQISASPYQLDELSVSAELKDQSALVNIETHHNTQRVNSDISVEELWSDLPSVDITVEGSNIDPAYWMADTAFIGDISFRSEISGRGFYPDSIPWDYSLSIDGIIQQLPISEFSLNGKASSQMATAEGRLKIQQSTADLMAEVRNLDKKPVYDYSIKSQNVNVGRLLGIENFATAINAEVFGSGEGFEPVSMRLQSFINIDSSLVNGELVENFSADVFIRDTVAVVDSMRLQSTIAEGSATARMHLLHWYAPENELSLEFRLKDVNALSPLLNVDEFRAQGAITGNLSPVEREKLQFAGTVDLSEIIYNNLFIAEAARGLVETKMGQDLEYKLDLELQAPSFSGIQLQGLAFMSRGVVGDSETNGSFDLRFNSPNEGRIKQSGRFLYSADSVWVHTSNLNIVSDTRTLSLEEPFNLLVLGDTLRMDTMRVASGNDAFFEAAAPLITPDEQHISVHAESLNTAVIQNAVFGEPYFTGTLSSRLQLDRVDTTLKAEGQLSLSELTYREINLDKFFLKAQVGNERLNGQISVLYEGDQLMEGEVNLPFSLGKPKDLPPAFFNQPVKGEMTISDISLERFESVIKDMGITNSSGIFSFEGKLGGTAGHPELTAAATLHDASLSGVPIDSIIAEVDYRHTNSLLNLNASVQSLNQKAADINAEIPLFINMRTFEADLPQEDDSVSVHIETNDFNLAALNDFFDDQTVKGAEGKLDGTLQVAGPLGDLKTDGGLTIKDGAFRFIPAGIRVDHIQSELIFAPDQLKISQFSAESGSGNLKAKGTIELEKLVPGEMDIQITAENFTAANTPEYSAIIDLDSKARGSFTKPKITGNLSFASGYVQLDNFGAESVESVELGPAEEEDTNVSLYDSLSLGMSISFNRRFFVRNERYLELEIELDGQVDLLKNPGEDMQLFGSIDAVNGYALPLGKRFELQEGLLTFAEDPTNPQLNIRTQYEPPQTEEEITIWYIIEGTVEDPIFKYESQPPMELENILSYTLFGKPFYALNPWKQAVAGSGEGTTASDVALGVLLDQVEVLATQKLGIDVVRIDNVSVGGKNGTSITTGWYINPKVFFAIQSIIAGSSPDTSFLLEYMLRENLELILRQGNIRQGVDIRWEYDY